MTGDLDVAFWPLLLVAILGSMWLFSKYDDLKWKFFIWRLVRPQNLISRIWDKLEK
jgi:hypothetical protein